MQKFTNRESKLTGPVDKDKGVMRAQKSGLQSMQQTLGNLAFQGLLQSKLSISRSDDPYEKEADSVAHQVMQAPINLSTGPRISRVSHSVQRVCATCGGAASGGNCPSCEEENNQGKALLQRKGDVASVSSNSLSSDYSSFAPDSKKNSPIQPSKITQSIGGGSALDKTTIDFFESRFKRDFNDVRVHTACLSNQVAQQINSRAFTKGNHIVFNSNQYQPHTVDGQKLLAHELTHVIQQRDIDTHSPLIQRQGLLHSNADSMIDESQRGGLTSEEITVIADYVRQLEGAPDPEIPLLDLYVDSDNPALPSDDSPDFESLLSGSSFVLPLEWELPSTNECPSACHSIARSHQRAFYERMAEQERQSRLSRWPGMHRGQHGEALAQQAGSLGEDISHSELQTSQLRLQLFDAVLEGGGSSDVTKNMRNSWAAAQQSTLFLEGLISDEEFSLPDNLNEPIRLSYVTYFNAMTRGLREKDRQFREIAKLFDASGSDPCPSCHDEVRQVAPIMGFENYNSFFPRPEPTQEQIITEWLEEWGLPEKLNVDEGGAMGSLETRLFEARGAAHGALTAEDWRSVIIEFRWATNEMDEILIAAAPDNSEVSAIVDQFDFSRKRMQRQREMMLAYPDAVKVQAIFYPRPESVDQLEQVENAEGTMEDSARGIPWQFYLTHTPVESGTTNFPENFEWQLHDITAPRRSDRTVKTRHKVGTIESAVRGIQIRTPIEQQNPPRSLFEQLNHKDFFPEGQLYWNYPHAPRATDSMETTASATFLDWITGIGIAISLIGSLVFAPFSTPMLAGVLLGTGLSIAGRVGRISEQEEHGVLTEGNVNQFYWDLSLDIVSALTLGMGRVMTASAQAGRLGRVATTARYWFALQRVELGMNIVNVGVIGADLVAQYHAIQRSDMSPEEKERALRNLTIAGVISGGISIIPVYAGLRDLRAGSVLRLDIDPDNPRISAGFLDEGLEGLEGVRTGDAGQTGDLTAGGLVHTSELETDVHRQAQQTGAELTLGDGAHGIAVMGNRSTRGFYFCSDQCALLLQKLDGLLDALPENYPGRAIYVRLRNQVRHANGRLRSRSFSQADADAKASEFAAALDRHSSFDHTINQLLQMNPAQIAAHASEIRLQLRPYADIVEVYATAQRHPGGRVAEGSIAPESAEGLAMGRADPGEVPVGHRLPRGTEDVDPGPGGFWGGRRGHADWFSDNPAVNAITNYQAVPYRNGEPVLTAWAHEQVILTRMTGVDKVDFAAADRGLLRQHPGRWRNKTEVNEWRRKNQLTWHHEPDLETMSLVPRALHGNVPHLGGASMTRAGQEVEHVPVLGGENPL